MYCSPHVSLYMHTGFGLYPWIGNIESDHHLITKHGLLLSSKLRTTKSTYMICREYFTMF